MTTLAACAPLSNRPNGASKLDRALRDWLEHPTAGPVRTLIRTQPGAETEVCDWLRRLGVGLVSPTTTPDLILAELSRDALDAAVRNRRIARVSFDAMVKSLSALGQNTLLGTEGLIVQSGTNWNRATSYTGHNVGVAVIDSGVNNGEIDSITFFDALNGMKKVTKYDDYGHGTHVSGLLASNGNYSDHRYEGVAPSVPLIEVKVLDKNGNGYTSDVINAINYVVQNRSALKVGVINLSLGHPIYEPAATDPLVQ